MSRINTVLVLVLTSATAFSSQFQNGSFELGSGPERTLSSGSTSITGWVVWPDNIDWVSGVGGYTLHASEGKYFLDLNGCCSGTGGIKQIFDTLPEIAYTV